MMFPTFFNSVQELVEYLQNMPDNLIPQIIARNLEKDCSDRGHPPSGVTQVECHCGMYRYE